MTIKTEIDTAERNGQTLTAFQSAWAAKDLNTLMNLVTDDIAFFGSVGPEPGQTWQGKVAVREGFARYLELDTGQAITDPAVIVGDKGFAGWSWIVDSEDGPIQTVRGFDAFTFRDGKIATKDGFRKTLPTFGKLLVSPPGTTDGTTTRYIKRDYRYLGLRQAEGISIKTYWIDAGQNGSEPPAKLSFAVDAQITKMVQEVHDLGSHHSQAYAIVHSGTVGTWLLFHWWAYSEINCHVLLRAEPGAYDFYRVGDPRLNACVWESIIIEHERQAWINNMLTDKPDPKAYQDDTLTDGAY
ncbi:MAG: nuclear transport factor 2 family protein [Alphaproteobacteria bacterium]|nr:nuclear transport factor 2 family protein [Alphaproteobacteria bacterium]